MNDNANQPPTGNTEWSPDEIKERRVGYLVVFFVMITGNIAGSLFSAEGAFIINFVIGIVFLALFYPVVKRVLGYSWITLIGISLVILFIPFLSLLTIAVIDLKVYDAIIKQKDGTVSVISTATNTVVGSPIPVGPMLWALAITPDGTTPYVANGGDNTVSVISTVVGSPTPVGSMPDALAITPDGTTLYVANWDSLGSLGFVGKIILIVGQTIVNKTIVGKIIRKRLFRKISG